MNRSELSNKIIQWSHRNDLGAQIDQFIDNTTYRLNSRLGKDYTLTGGSAENEVSTYYPMIYIYGALREMCIYINDGPGARSYDELWDKEVNNLEITAQQGSFKGDTAPPILSEYEQEVLNAT